MLVRCCYISSMPKVWDNFAGFLFVLIVGRKEKKNLWLWDMSISIFLLFYQSTWSLMSFTSILLIFNFVLFCLTNFFLSLKIEQVLRMIVDERIKIHFCWIVAWSFYFSFCHHVGQNYLEKYPSIQRDV